MTEAKRHKPCSSECLNPKAIFRTNCPGSAPTHVETARALQVPVMSLTREGSCMLSGVLKARRHPMRSFEYLWSPFPLMRGQSQQLLASNS